MSTKYTVAGVGGLGAMAAAMLAAGQSNQAGVAMLATDRLGAEDYEFMRYISEQGRSYGTVAEFMFRGDIFKKNHAEIAAHNADANKTHTVGHNQFSDRTAEEMSRLLGYRGQAAKNVRILDESNLQSSVDWRTKGAVTPVKDQGQCGSCWAFSTTGAVEGAMFLKTGTLSSFSEQQLVDCSKQNNGCNGGLMDYAFQYIESNGLELESEYPYTAVDGTCRYDSSSTVGQVRSYVDVQSSTSQMKAALNLAPVSVAIEADQMVFQYYTSGVITSGCGSSLDHGVLAVGYGTENGTEYVLVKNSWGPSWGDNGYVKMAFNQCGVTTSASYPTE